MLFSRNAPEEDDEVKLGRRFKQGDHSCVRDIIKKLLPGIGVWLNKKYPALSFQIETVLEDTLSRAWLARETFDENKGSFKAWLAIIAKNTACDELRKRRYQIHVTCDLDVFPSKPCCPAAVQSYDAGLIEFVEKFIERLSNDEREIVFAYMERDGERDWTREPAEKLKVSKNSIRIKMSRLKSRLREELTFFYYNT